MTLAYICVRVMVNYGTVIDYTEIIHELAFFIKLEAVFAHVMF
jgi:hypothetical protein